MRMPVETYDSQMIEVNGLRLHVVLAGPADGKPLLLLHGFPEFWYGWHKQIEPLTAAGYRLILPDQRGYNLSDKPRGVFRYQMEPLVADMIALLDALGYGSTPVGLVGHDWGGVVAWDLLERHPERFHHAVILNAPYLAVWMQGVMRHPRQLLLSWYVYLFQLPWVAEHLFFPVFTRLALSTARDGSFAAADLERYAQAWAQPGVARATINWYRAAFRGALRGMFSALRQRQSPLAASIRPVTVPVRLLWGKGDVALLPALAEESIAVCTQGELRFVSGATHWVQHDQPEVVTQAILEFMA